VAFRVEISAQAERDAETILDWLLTQHTGQAGIDWFLGLGLCFHSRDHKHAQLRIADAATGSIRDVLEETAETQYESGQGRVS
jgi:hypothetical protein